MQITLSDGEDYPILEKIIFYSVAFMPSDTDFTNSLQAFHFTATEAGLIKHKETNILDDMNGKY